MAGIEVAGRTDNHGGRVSRGRGRFVLSPLSICVSDVDAEESLHRRGDVQAADDAQRGRLGCCWKPPSIDGHAGSRVAEAWSGLVWPACSVPIT